MEQRRLRLGDILDDYCPRERRVTNHVVVAMIEDEVKQTRCSTCDAEHPYKGGKAPRRRKPTASPFRRPPPSSPVPPEVESEPESDQPTEHVREPSPRRRFMPTRCRRRVPTRRRSMRGRSIVRSSARRCRGPKGSRPSVRFRSSRFARTALVGTATISAAASRPKGRGGQVLADEAGTAAARFRSRSAGAAGVRDAAVSRPAASIVVRRSARAERPGAARALAAAAQ